MSPAVTAGGPTAVVGVKNAGFGQVWPPVIDWKIPDPLTAASTVFAAVVSRARSGMNPARTGEPLLKVGELFPKLPPLSFEKKRPPRVATSICPGPGKTIFWMACPVKIPPGLTVDHVAPESTDW